MNFDDSCFEVKEPLVTIIIPVYKTEKYLVKCIESVLNQSYQNLDILVIDDGSPDKSGEIAENYAKKEDRIRVIHKKNGGLSDARNKGIESAKGDWILFLDSDDTLPKHSVEILLNGALKKKVPISIGTYEIVTEEKGTVKKHPVPLPFPAVYRGEELLKYFLCTSQKHEYICIKLFHKKLFDEIRFPVGKIYEDIYTNPRLLYEGGSAVLINEPIYHYYQRSDSITGNQNMTAQMQALKSRLDAKKFIDAHYPDLKKYTSDLVLETCCFLFEKVELAGVSDHKNELKILTDTFRKAKKTAAKQTLALKGAILLFSISPFLFRKAYCLYAAGKRKLL